MRTYYTWKAGELREVKGEIVREQPLTIYVNGQRFITLLSTPRKLEALVVGYLWLERVIGGLEEVRRLAVSEIDGRAEVDLVHEVDLPEERILTSGCGGGITFRIDPRMIPRIQSSLTVPPGRLSERMKDLYRVAEGYRASGLFASALRTTTSTSRGSAGSSRRGGSGSSSSARRITWSRVRPGNGTRPVRHW